MGLLGRLFRPAARADNGPWIAAAVQSALAGTRRVRTGMGLDAAQTPPWAANWGHETPGINQDAFLSLPAARARSKNLARNNEYAKRFLTQLKSNVLGPTGIQLQSRLRKRDGSAADDVNERIEAAFGRWKKRGACDVTGTLTWCDIERLQLEQLARCGEFLARIALGKGRGPHGFQIQVLDPAQLDVLLNRELANGGRITMGVELSPEGVPLAYHLSNRARPDFDPFFSHYDSHADHTRVPAQEILHRFIVEEPNQVRGIPWLAISARRLWLVRDYEQAAAVAASNAAKRIGFFISPNGEAPPGIADQIVSAVLDQAKAAGKILSADEVKALTDVAEKYATTVPGQFDTLPTGYDFKQFESDYPHTNYAEYVKSCIRGAASGLGVSYVTMGNDLESVNYSSARVGIVDEREFYRGLQEWFATALHADVAAQWLPMAMLTDPDLARLDASRIDQYLESLTWQPRRWIGIDPLKEAQANAINLELKLTSRRRLILERAEDPDEVFAEVAQEEAELGPVKTTAVTPQALDEPAQGKARLRAVGDDA